MSDALLDEVTALVEWPVPLAGRFEERFLKLLKEQPWLMIPIVYSNGNRATQWQHNPQHRGGVRYNNRDVQQRFGNNNRGSAQNRMDFRGRNGQQVLNPGQGNRAGDRGGARRRSGRA